MHTLGQPVSNSELLDLLEVRRLSATGEALAIRTRSGLSLADIAGAVGRTPATISRWEHGQVTPYGPAARRYGRLLAELRDHIAAAGTPPETPNPARQPGSGKAGRSGDLRTA